MALIYSNGNIKTKQPSQKLVRGPELTLFKRTQTDGPPAQEKDVLYCLILEKYK